jgi:hypothetical protein
LMTEVCASAIEGKYKSILWGWENLYIR